MRFLSPGKRAAQELIDPAGRDVAQPGAQREHPVEVGQGAGNVAGEQAVAFDAEQVGQLAVAQQQRQGARHRGQDQCRFGVSRLDLREKAAGCIKAEILRKNRQRQAHCLAGVTLQAAQRGWLGIQQSIQRGDQRDG